MDLSLLAGGCLEGELTPPGDKSISHRALLLGALATGTTLIDGFLESEDCLTTLKNLRLLGVEIERTHSQIRVHGVGLIGLKSSSKPLDCGNSGTTMRLLAGILAAQPFPSRLQGDHSLQQRPMERIILPLQQMGARLSGRQEKNILPPIQINPVPSLQGIHYTLPVASAQVKSCLLLAGLYAKGDTQLSGKIATRDHTERLLKHMGVSLEITEKLIHLNPDQILKGQLIRVPGDFSAAAFFMLGASIAPQSHIRLSGVGINPYRTGLLTLLEKMGARISLHAIRLFDNEPVADIEVQGASLRGITVPVELVPHAIDEFPAFFVAAACAQGTTEIRGLEELRFKESDRIATMAAGLKALGINLEILPDGLIIEGKGSFQGGTVDSKGDHRVAMAFAMASLRAKAPITILNCDNIATSFPQFQIQAKRLGLQIFL